MNDEFTPRVPRFRLTHVDGVRLRMGEPAPGTPRVGAGRLAFLPRDPYRWMRETDGSVFLSLDTATGTNLGGLAGDYLEVAPGHYTFPVPFNPRRTA